MVTVSSGTSTAPTVFPLAQCGSGTGDSVTLGCLATDFTPSSLSFKWTDESGTTLTDFVQYPSIQAGSTYKGISQVRVSRADWDSRKAFNCTVEHPAGSRVSQVQKPQEILEHEQVPTTFKVLLDMTKRGAASFSCAALDFSPKAYEMKWLRNGQEIQEKISSFMTSSERKLANSTVLYSAISFLQIKESLWQGKDTQITCVFKQGDSSMNQTVTYTPHDVQVCHDELLKITIKPLSLEDMFENKKAELVCEVLHKQGDITSIKWLTKNKHNLMAKNETETTPDNFLLHKHTVDVLYEEWSQGMEWCCAVEHKDILETKKECFVKENGGHIVPSVFLLPPVEQTSKDMVVLTCYVKDFYPKEILVSWFKDEKPIHPSNYTTYTTNHMQNNGYYSLYGQLTISYAEWKNSDSVYSCVVKHESLMSRSQIKVIVRSFMSKTQEKTNLVNLNITVPQPCKA